MEQAIAKELVKRKIIKEDTEVNAWYCAPAFGGGTVDKTGSFTINSIELNNGKPVFRARSNVDGKWENITINNIVSVDGMEPNKLAEAYGLKKKTKKAKKKKQYFK